MNKILPARSNDPVFRSIPGILQTAQHSSFRRECDHIMHHRRVLYSNCAVMLLGTVWSVLRIAKVGNDAPTVSWALARLSTPDSRHVCRTIEAGQQRIMCSNHAGFPSTTFYPLSQSPKLAHHVVLPDSLPREKHLPQNFSSSQTTDETHLASHAELTRFRATDLA